MAALPRLTALVASGADAPVRAAALRALEGMDDTRCDAAAIAALASADVDVATAAIGVLRGRVSAEAGVLDALTAVALDTARDSGIRLAALDALSDLPRDLVAPVLESARAPSQALRPGPLRGGPLELREWLATEGASAPLSVIHDHIALARDRERSEPRQAQEWLVTRGAAHALLAHRGSRVALYDLREAFDTATAPLPLDFLVAAAAIGDASCLEPLARSWAASPDDAWWRDRLVDAASDIVGRTPAAGRSRILTRIRSKWPGFL